MRGTSVPETALPVCPLCDGPCTHDFPRSEYRMPDRLPESDHNEAKPAPPVKENRRGKRAHHGPAEDRMRRPSEDRSD